MTGQVPAGPVENSLSSLASEYPEGHQHPESTPQDPKLDRLLGSLSPCGQRLVGRVAGEFAYHFLGTPSPNLQR